LLSAFAAMFLRLLLPLVAFCSLFSDAYPHENAHDHDHSEQHSLPSRWYHDEDHPVHALFRRQNAVTGTDGVQYPAVGSATWTAAYPPAKANSSAMPQAWIDALNAAVAAGSIPNIPIPTVVNSSPVYPSSANPNSPTICSAYAKCRMPDDIWDAPNGAIGIGFDDGPSLGSSMLYDFLGQNNQRATHFMIGLNILNNPQLFLRAFNQLQGDIAVHTWTHPYMSSLSNADIVAELGWTMQIIHNSTGGRLPRFWRPPYGDADNRVRAIARELFGLTTILWNQDTSDWSLTSTGGTTLGAINASMTQWLTGPKTPGLIILEHELSNLSAQAFESAYPLMVSQGWTLPSVATINGTGVYYNSQNATSPVEEVDGVLLSDFNAATSSVSSSSAVTSSAPSSASNPVSTTSIHGSQATSTSDGSLRYVVSPGVAVICLVFASFI